MSDPEKKKIFEKGDKTTLDLSKPIQKEKREKKKSKETPIDSTIAMSDSSTIAMSSQLAAELQSKIQLLQASTTAAKDLTDAKQHNYQFWATQPVPSLEEKTSENNFIRPNEEVDKVKQTPYPLPEPFVWSDVSLLEEAQLNELYTLLTENYVEDDENMFRFDYGREFLKWALMAPGWHKEWHCGIRAANPSGKLLAFIAAVPAIIRIYDKTLCVVEINFLCVHKKLRSKRVAPVLIREITRRVNLRGIFQATFTAGVVIPKPMGSCRYWHRSLNPKKLTDTNFSHIPRNMTLQRVIKLNKLPEHPKCVGIQPLEERHLQSAHKLLSIYLERFDLVPIFEIDDFRHFFLPQKDVIYSYVIETEGEVTDFLSFYCLPSTVMHHPIYKQIKAGYSFYNVATSVPLIELMSDALILARNEQFDVFNALDLMENKSFLEELKFGIGDGNLQYYMYNWKCPDLTPDRIGLVLQ